MGIAVSMAPVNKQDDGSSCHKSPENAAMDGCNARSTLGVTPDASIAQIKAAYRALAKDTHPDRGGDAATFDRLTRAYEYLVAEATKPSRPVSAVPIRSVLRRPMWTRVAPAAFAGSATRASAPRRSQPEAMTFAEHLRRATAAA
jgi:hypothetical protein